MKQHWIAFVIFATITGGTFLGISCEPKAVSQGTVEISEIYNNGCTIYANIDGGTGNNATTFGFSGSAQQLYTFSNTVSPGNHTLNFTTSNLCNSNGCEISGSDYTNVSSYPLTFYVGAGEIYEAYVSQGGACNNINVGSI